jgi:DNA topoisomerase-3
MAKTLLIAEKPDQAKSFYLPLLEKVSGEKLASKGRYFESRTFYLTWFFGHLLENIKPDDYNEKYKTWKMEDLPIIPGQMIYKYTDASRKEQGQLILKLCHDSDEIICGTDPDREGQGIFDTFAKYYKIQKPMKRLWATSLTEKDLFKSWNGMKKMEEYKNLSLARELRADSDWLVGMNATRAYTVIAKTTLPIGRVLTSTLALIVQRDFEVENYKESFFYQLKGIWNGVEFKFFNESGNKFDSSEMLDKIKSECQGKAFSLTSFKVDTKTENPPKTFNLPDLQKEANKKFGFPLDKTLKLAQGLYEKKVTTYPRTDSPYLPESDLAEYHALVRKSAKPDEVSLLRPVFEKPSCVKNTESPHTALIITGDLPSSLSGDEAKLYELIRSRFVCAFMVPRTYEQYDLEISDANGKTFKAIVSKDILAGFRNLYKDSEKDDDVQECAKEIKEDELRKNGSPIEGLAVNQFKKTKPKYFTPATLITAMQTCGRSLENEDARKILAETKGIGTPATQASYPNILERDGYVVFGSGHYCSTPRGRKLIAEISPDLKTPALTADWEMKLKLVEQGKLSEESYRKEFTQYLHKIIEEARERQSKLVGFEDDGKTGIICPICKNEIIRNAWGYSCVSKECGLSVSYKFAGKNLSEKQIETLLRTGRTPMIKGFKSARTGNDYDAKLVIKMEAGRGKVGFEFK